MANLSGRYFPFQTIHLGATGSVTTFNEQTLSNAGFGPFLGQLGMVIEQDGKVYRLVQFDNGTGNVASAANGAAHWKTRASFIVTSDQTDAEATVNSIAGGFLGVQTDQYYCFVQIGGSQSLTTGGSVVDGDLLVGSSTDLTFVTQSAVNQLPVAVAYADDVSTTVAAYWILGAML